MSTTNQNSVPNKGANNGKAANTATRQAAGPRRIAAPRALPEALPFWEAAKEGRLLVKRCADCGEAHYYPRDICPHCLSANTTWTESAGEGEIYSYSTMSKDDARYTLAYVTLDEGVTMLTNLVDCDPSTLAIGHRVQVVFKPSDGGYPIPMFTPA